MFSRLFEMVYLLMEKPYITAKDLAVRLEVSERTIYRYVDKLSVAGIPVYTNRGKNGGISLLSDFVIDRMVLTSEEKTKILESLQAFQTIELENEKKSLHKIKSFLGDEIQDWIEVDFSEWSGSKEEANLFQQIKSAILHRNYLEIEYSGIRHEASVRRIKPLKLCFRSQAWYLYAYCELRKDYRFFKLRRITKLYSFEERFEAETVGKLFVLPDAKEVQEKKKIKIRVKIHKTMAFRAYDEMNEVTVMEDGNLSSDIEFTDMLSLVSYILSYGPYIEVIEPSEVREEIKKMIIQMNQIYTGGDL